MPSLFLQCGIIVEPKNLTQTTQVVLAMHSASSHSQGPSKLLDATPLFLAALYYALTPFFSQQVRSGYIDYLQKVNSEWQGPKASIPPHLAPEALAANTDWLIDTPQMVPTLLLPLAAAVFALHDSDLSGVVLAFAAIVICAAVLWIYSRSPLQYRSLRFVGNRYTLVPALGVVLNAAAAVLLLTR